MKILVVNAGSSSLKYQLINMEGEKLIAKGNCERIGIDGCISGKTADGRSFDRQVTLPDHTAAFGEVVKALTEGECKVLDSMNEVSAVGHRIVQGGSIFTKATLVDDDVVEKIAGLSDLAPLHNPAHVQGINAARKLLPDIPHVVVFDTAFHQTMPDYAYMYPIPYKYYEKYAVRRYGFHGSSHKYVSSEAIKRYNLDPDNSKIITCHLGNGSSISAVKNGKCVDTSMGFTPLDGFMMGTRSGGLDPSIITYLEKKDDLSADDISDLTNKQSGIYGISGISSDMRDITKGMQQGDTRAALAYDMLCYEITKFIGGYIAAMGGVDAIVFTGGIGENDPLVRERIAFNLSYLGITFDYEKNLKVYGDECILSKKDSTVLVTVLPTNEELVIARDTKKLVESL